MSKFLTWFVSKFAPCELDGVPVLMMPGLGEHVEVIFAFDVFTFWGGKSLAVLHDEQFLHDCRAAIDAAAWQLNEPAALEIHMSWGLYRKLRSALKSEKKGESEIQQANVLASRSGVDA